MEKHDLTNCPAQQQTSEIEAYPTGNRIFQTCLELNHGHYVTMTGFGSKDNNYKGVGVAPDAKVIPYREGSSMGWAFAMKRARIKGANIVSMSLGIAPRGSFLRFVAPIGEIIWGAFSNHSTLSEEIHLTVQAGIPVVVSVPNVNEGGKGVDIRNEGDYPSDHADVIPESTPDVF